MVTGGHGRSGPPANPFSLRSDRRQGEWTDLPPETLQDPPEWPLGDQPSDREQVLWDEAWRTPQATMWHALHLVDEVAIYLRIRAEAELPHASRDARTFYRQHRELLGLSTAGLSRLKWRITDQPAWTGARIIPTSARSTSLTPEEAKIARETWRTIPENPETA